MDAANVDLKAFTERFYRDVCAGHLQDVLDTLVYLKRETDVWFEITTLLIPELNDSDVELEAECLQIELQPLRVDAVLFGLLEHLGEVHGGQDRAREQRLDLVGARFFREEGKQR